MKLFYQIILSLALFGLINLSACVSNKKYQAMLALQEDTEATAEAISLKNEQLKNENKRLMLENKILREENQNIKTNFIQNAENQDIAEKELALKYQNLLAQYEELLQNSSLEAKIYRDSIARNKPNLLPSNQTLSDLKKSIPQVNPSRLTTGNDPDDLKINSNQMADNQSLRQLIESIFSHLNTQEFRLFEKNNVLMIGWADDWLFTKKYEFNPPSLLALQQLADGLKSFSNLNIYLHTETQSPEYEHFTSVKIEKLKDFFKQYNLKTQILPKDFAPLAFATSGTESRLTFTYCLIKLGE